MSSFIIQHHAVAMEQSIEKSNTEIAKFVPKGFENNFAESVDKALNPPVREKMGFLDLLFGGSSKKTTKAPASSEKKLENEKSKGSMNKS